jgi:hypothetical protein
MYEAAVPDAQRRVRLDPKHCRDVIPGGRFRNVDPVDFRRPIPDVRRRCWCCARALLLILRGYDRPDSLLRGPV